MSLPATHSKASKYRLLSEEKLRDLAENIKDQGQIDPVVFSSGPASPGLLIDGRNRWLACELIGRLPDTDKIAFETEQDIIDFIESKNDFRRHLTQEEQEAGRQERIARVVAAREAGKSYGVIAKEEGVSRTQVFNDLKEATVKGLTVELPAVIVGKDGKSYPAQRPVSSPAGEHQAPRLLISTPEERAAISGPALYDEAEARREEVAEVEATREHSPHAPAQPEPTETPAILPTPEPPPVVTASENKKGPAAIMASGRDDHNTPPELLSVIRAFGDGITLDPCHNANSTVGARHILTKEQDGLHVDWAAYLAAQCAESLTERQLVFINPPYDQETLTHVNDHAQKLAGDWLDVISLVPLKGDQEWFQVAMLAFADAVCFIKGRVRFWADGERQQGAAFESILLYYGSRPAEFCDCFGEEIGVCLNLSLYRQAREAA